MKQVIIDIQVLQTNALKRGVGNYVINLIENLDFENLDVYLMINLKLKNYNEIYTLFNNKPVKFLKLRLPIPKNGGDFSKKYHKKLTKKLAISFKNNETFFLLPNIFMFDYYTDFPDSFIPMILVHDITPLILWNLLGNYFPPQFYFSRFKLFYNSNIIFTNSNTTKLDLIKYIGIDKRKLINLNGGSVNHEICQKPKFLDDNLVYILFPTGEMIHKNNEVVVEGFEKFNQINNNKFKLIITSFFSQANKDKLLKISKNIIFSGNVLEPELAYLYKNSRLIIFGSLYEGLGLPVLDAVYYNKPIVLSDISAFREIDNKQNAFYFFNKKDSSECAKQLSLAFKQHYFLKKQLSYKKILKKYSWKKTGRIFSQSVLVNKERTIANQVKLKKIAVVSLYPTVNFEFYNRLEPLHYLLKDGFLIDYYFILSKNHTFLRPSFLEYVNQGDQHNNIDQLSQKQYQNIIYWLDLKTLKTSKNIKLLKQYPGVVIVDSIKNISQIDQQRLIEIKNNSMAFIVCNDKSNLKIISLISKYINN